MSISKTKQILLFLIFTLISIPLSSKTILLKSGETIKGEVTAQDNDFVFILDSKGASQKISKKKILKIVYKEVSDEALIEIRKEEEKKLALKSEKEAKEKELEIEEELRRAEKERLEQEKLKAKEIEKEPKPFTNTSLLFSPFAKNCVLFSSKTEWYWLYGNMAFSETEWSALLPNEPKTIQIREISTMEDTITTILVGTLTSISRKTRIVEVCDPDPIPKLSPPNPKQSTIGR